MKNTKKIISLVLAICMLASLAISASAANTVDASGGTGTSSVTLSSTADGSIGGDPAATKMSVTVPTVLPIAVGTDGTVSTATDAKIVNNSFGAVKVANVSIEAAQGWNLTAFGDKATLAKEKVDSNKFGFQIALGNGEKKLTDNKNASKQTLLDAAAEGCYMSGVGDTSVNSIGIAYENDGDPASGRTLRAAEGIPQEKQPQTEAVHHRAAAFAELQRNDRLMTGSIFLADTPALVIAEGRLQLMRLRIHAHLVQHEGQPFQLGIAHGFEIPYSSKPPILIFLFRQDARVDEHIHRRGISARLNLMVHGAVDFADHLFLVHAPHLPSAISTIPQRACKCKSGSRR